MPQKNHLEKASKQINNFFDNLGPKVYRKIDLKNILDNHSDEWHLENQTSLEHFIKYARKIIPLKKVQLAFPNRPHVRYISGACSIYEVTQSLKEEGYFSHHTAAEIHDLLGADDQIFFNFEQQMRSQSSGEMTQDAINRAFHNKARISQNKAKYKNYTIWLLNGKNTGCYGVIKFSGNLRVTNIARTLIDMTVRPSYSGGPLQILQAYRRGIKKVDGETIVQTLAKLGHRYPYHQVIGFYMETAGFSEKDLALLKNIPMKLDFYVDYQMVEPLYSSTWKLYYPAILRNA